MPRVKVFREAKRGCVPIHSLGALPSLPPEENVPADPARPVGYERSLSRLGDLRSDLRLRLLRPNVDRATSPPSVQAGGPAALFYRSRRVVPGVRGARFRSATHRVGPPRVAGLCSWRNSCVIARRNLQAKSARRYRGPRLRLDVRHEVTSGLWPSWYGKNAPCPGVAQRISVAASSPHARVFSARTRVRVEVK